MKMSKGFLSILATCTCATGVAAPPAKPPPTPPDVDIAYLSISNNSWTGWPPAAIRGIDVSAAGALITDVELWRARNRYTQNLAWDASGKYLAWAEAIDRQGTQALLVAEPGQVPRVAYQFSSDYIYSNNNYADGLAWGRGCGATPVLYFWGVAVGAVVAVWVVDPFAATPVAQEVFRGPARPVGERGGSLQGLAVSPQGRILVAGAYSYELGDRGLVALPLGCESVSSLPQPSGPAQPLLAARYESDQAWIHSFDWSGDGRRLAISMGRWVPISAGSAYAYDPELWIAEIEYVASAGAEQATVTRLWHSAAGVTVFPAWAPVSEGTACDRLAFTRSSVVWLHDVPRDGFSGIDCAIGTPTAIGGKAVAALDWR